MKQTILLKIILTTLSTLLLSITTISASLAAPGPLFTVVAAGNTLTVTPTANHYYPAMGVKLASAGHTVGGCTPHGNGFCLFAASNTVPKALTLAGPNSNVQGTVCLNGSAHYSCQTFNIKSTLCAPGGTCRVFASSSRQDGAMMPSAPIPNHTYVPGIAGGDSICQALANNAALGGIWKAWISGGSGGTIIDAKDNINYDATITYHLVGTGALLANPGELLITNTINLATNLNRDETGAILTTNASAYTGSLEDGTANIVNRRCNLIPPGTPGVDDWTYAGAVNLAGVGNYNNINSGWTDTGIQTPCNQNRRLWCFEVPM
jgi:hypothetical protein